MLSYLMPITVIAALALAIPLTIILGQWLRGGPIAAASGVALLAFGVFWLRLGNVFGQAADTRTPVDLTVSFVTFLSGALLLIVAWTLALADAARSRRWGWLAALCLATYASVAATFGLLTTSIISCTFTDPTSQFYCASLSPVTKMLIIFGCFVGPAAALVYAVRPPALRQRTQPDGLSVSSLDATQTESL